MCVLFYSSHVFCSLSHSEALQEVVNLVCQQLQTTIKQGNISEEDNIVMLLTALVHLDPFGATQNGEMGFMLIDDILSSSFSERSRYRMASKVVELLGHLFFPKKDGNISPSALLVKPTWIPPLLSFLSLSEKFYAVESPPYAGSIALRILPAAHIPADSGAIILPILSSTLLPTHPLQLRSLALKVFNKSSLGWFSSQMEDVPVGDLKNLLRALGDPFLLTRDTSLLERTPPLEVDHETLSAVVILIEFASSNLWRNHLHSSNFTTCEEFLSTEEGKRTAIRRMHKNASLFWPEFHLTAAKVVAAIGRLEELHCLKTAEVVIMWAWTICVFDAEDHDAWGLIERTTRSFYKTHGVGLLEALRRHVTDKTIGDVYADAFRRRHKRFLCRAVGARRSAPPGSLDRDAYFGISQVCQLKRLYCLFWYDPTSREVVVAGGEVDKGRNLPSAVAPVLFVDWACDYP